MTRTLIIALAAEAYAGVLLLGFRHEVAGALVHAVRACSCRSWRRCDRLHHRAR